MYLGSKRLFVKKGFYKVTIFRFVYFHITANVLPISQYVKE